MRLSTALACSLFAARPKRGEAQVGMGNPAAINCVDQNFTNLILYAPNGDQYGVCIFSNTTACDDWAFERGSCDTANPNFSVYCADNGGEVSQESVDWGEVEGAPPATYGVCTSNGEQCTEYDYYGNNNCSFVDPMSTAPADGTPAIIGMPNPASTGCVEKGGTDESLYEADGGEYDVCVFNDGTACDSWALERGECTEGTTPVFSTFCADSGGEISEEDVDWGEVEGAPPATYEVCTVNGFQCAANDYYSTGCADFTVPSPTPGTDSTGTATETIGEAVSATKVPEGESAQIDCQSGGYCCMEGTFATLSGDGIEAFGGDSVCADSIKVTSGVASECGYDNCVITCTGACDVTKVVETPAGTPPIPSPDSTGTATETTGEAMSATKVPIGESAQIDCQSGGYCCMVGNIGDLTGGGNLMTFGGDSFCDEGFKVSSGLATDCSSDDCVITCTRNCDVQVVGVVDTPVVTAPVPSPDSTGTTTETIGEAMSATKVPKGESAQIECQSGSHCCMEGTFDTLSGDGVMAFGGGSVCADGVKVTSGVASECGSDDCVITCTGACDVVTKVAGVVETPAGNPPIPSPDSTGTATETIGEAISATKVPKGESAQIECQSGSHCCMEGTFDTLSGDGIEAFGGGSVCADSIKVTSGVATDCGSDDCVITCTGACDLVTKVAGVVETPAGNPPVPAPEGLSSTPQSLEPSGSYVLSHVFSLVVVSLQIFCVLV